MKKIILFTLLLVGTFSMQAQKALDYLPNNIIVQTTDNQAIDDWLNEFNAQYTTYGKLTLARTIVAHDHYYLLNFDGKKVTMETLLEVLSASPNILNANPDYLIFERDSVPSDPFYEEQWGLDMIEVEQVWAENTGGETPDGKKIVVAVIDSGFDINHEDIADNIWQNEAEIPANGIDDDNNGYIDDETGWNIKNNSPIHDFDSSHGTSVVGIIGAKGDNNKGIAGVNWNVEIMLFTVNSTSQIGEALEYVRVQRELYNESNGTEGAYVVATSTSLGRDMDFCDQHPVWGDRFDELGAIGILNIAATTNGEINVDLMGDMPTSCPSDYLLTVTNVNRSDNKDVAGFGDDAIDIGAPGGPSNMGVYTIRPNNDYNSSFGGTSAAAPHTSGVAALLYAMPCEDFQVVADDAPSIAPLLLKKAIMDGGAPNSSLQDNTVSGNRLSAYGSMIWLHALCQIVKGEDLSPEALLAASDKINVENYVDDNLGFYRVYPNPVNDVLKIDYVLDDFRDLDFKIYDATGREMAVINTINKPFEAQFLTIDVSNFPHGTYFLSIQNGKNPVTTKFVVVE